MESVQIVTKAKPGDTPPPAATTPTLPLLDEVVTEVEFENGAWVPKERHIVKVVRVHKKEAEPDLFTEPPKPKGRKKK